MQDESNCNRDTETVPKRRFMERPRRPVDARSRNAARRAHSVFVGLFALVAPTAARAQTAPDGDAAAAPTDAAVLSSLDASTSGSSSSVIEDAGIPAATAAISEHSHAGDSRTGSPGEPSVNRVAPESGVSDGSATVRLHSAPSRGAGDVPITVGRLGQVPLANASDVLRLAPGIFLSNGLGEGHAEQVFLRGFDARIGQDLEFQVNGVPINEPAHPHGQGQADTHFLIPELIESVRVLEGPFDPHQGDFAVAGSATFNLRMPARGAVAQYRYGSYNTHRLVALWGPDGESPGTFGGAELAASDGYGANRGYERAVGNAQYEGHAGSLTWRVLLMTYATRYRSAGVLREDDYDRGRVDFYGTYDPTQGGEVSRHQASVELESNRESSTLRALAWASLRSFRLRENFTGFLLDTQQPWQSPHGQRGDGIDQAAQSLDVGARASARYRTTLGGLAQSVEAGLYGRHVGVDASQQRMRAGTGVAYRTDFDLASAVSNVALYVDGELRFWRWLALRGGVRADLFQYDVLDNCAVRGVSVRGAPLDAACLSADRAGYRLATERRTAGALAVQPRATLLAGPWRGVTLSLSGGLGSRSADPVYLGNDQQGPFSPVAATEAGVVYDRRLAAFALTARALFFYTHVGQDLVFDEQQGRNSLASGTTRLGALAAARLTGAWFDVAAHVTWARATYDDTGYLVPYVPQLVARLDASATRPLPLRLRGRAFTASASLGVTYVAPRPLPLSERGDAVFTVDAQASLRWTHFELGVVSQNLLDARYRWGQFNYVSDFRSGDFPTLVATRHFSAGPPRMVFVVFTLHLGRAAARHGAPTEES